LLILALVLAVSRPQGSAAADSEQDDENELSQVVVTSTRTPTLVEDEPLHVEAVPTEEIEENLAEAPGKHRYFRSCPGSMCRQARPDWVAPQCSCAGCRGEKRWS
jgi:outer membrane cobalamin receptor